MLQLKLRRSALPEGPQRITGDAVPFRQMTRQLCTFGLEDVDDAELVMLAQRVTSGSEASPSQALLDALVQSAKRRCISMSPTQLAAVLACVQTSCPTSVRNILATTQQLLSWAPTATVAMLPFLLGHHSVTCSDSFLSEIAQVSRHRFNQMTPQQLAYCLLGLQRTHKVALSKGWLKDFLSASTAALPHMPPKLIIDILITLLATPHPPPPDFISAAFHHTQHSLGALAPKQLARLTSVLASSPALLPLPHHWLDILLAALRHHAPSLPLPALLDLLTAAAALAPPPLCTPSSTSPTHNHDPTLATALFDKLSPDLPPLPPSTTLRILTYCATHRLPPPTPWLLTVLPYLQSTRFTRNRPHRCATACAALQSLAPLFVSEPALQSLTYSTINSILLCNLPHPSPNHACFNPPPAPTTPDGASYTSTSTASGPPSDCSWTSLPPDPPRPHAGGSPSSPPPSTLPWWLVEALRTAGLLKPATAPSADRGWLPFASMA